MTNEISNTDDMIDSRDIIERIDQLDGRAFDHDDLTDDEKSELKALKALAVQADSCADWGYGEALIRHSYFVDYIKELIDDCYSMPKEMTSGEWPWRHVTVDYEAAAKEAECDYTFVDFGGVEYLIRS